MRSESSETELATTFCAGTIRLEREGGIVRIDFAPGARVTLETARDEIAALKRLTGGKRHPVLCDFGNVVSTDLRARIYYGGHETRSAYKVVALLASSPMARALGNVFLAFHGVASEGRIRLFAEEDEALAWLRTHVL